MNKKVQGTAWKSKSPLRIIGRTLTPIRASNTNQFTHFATIYESNGKVMITGLDEEKEMESRKEKYNINNIKEIRLEKWRIIKSNINNIETIKTLCSNQIMRIVSDGSHKENMLTFGVIIEYNGIRIEMAGTVPSYKEEVSSHRAEIDEINAGIELVEKLQEMHCVPKKY